MAQWGDCQKSQIVPLNAIIIIIIIIIVIVVVGIIIINNAGMPLLIRGLNYWALVCGIFWSSSLGVSSGCSGFLPSPSNPHPPPSFLHWILTWTINKVTVSKWSPLIPCDWSDLWFSCCLVAMWACVLKTVQDALNTLLQKPSTTALFTASMWIYFIIFYILGCKQFCLGFEKYVIEGPKDWFLWVEGKKTDWLLVH